MYNSYISSAMLTLTTKGSLSFSVDDYSNLLNSRFEHNPSSKCCCSCCNCCSCSGSSLFATHRLPLKPSLFYGLRQSTLIQWSPCRRLILGGGGGWHRYYYRVPAYGLDHHCYEVSCSFKNKGGGERIERRRKGRLGRQTNFRERRFLSSVDDAEAVINLLSEEVTEECLGDRDQNVNAGKCQQKRKKNVGLDLLESDSNSQSRLVTIESRKELFQRKERREDSRRKGEGNEYRKKEERDEHRRKEERDEHRRKEERDEHRREERKIVPRGESHRERKGSSSFSSYHSLSSAGDFEGDKETGDEHADLLEESLSGYTKQLCGGENRLEGQVVEVFRRHANGWQAEILDYGTRTNMTGADWDLRKKTEKKLTEIDEMQTRKESLQMHARMASTSESDHSKVSSYHKQIDNENEKLTLAANFEKETRKQYSQTGDEVTEQSQFRRNYLGITHKQESQAKNGKATSQSQRQFDGRAEHLSVDADLVGEEKGENRNTVSEGNAKNNARRYTLQHAAMSETGNADNERVSNLQSQFEARMKNHEEDRTLRSVWEKNGKHHQSFERITGQIDSRKGTHQLSEVSEIEDNNCRKTSILCSQSGVKNQEGSMGAICHSVDEAKEQKFRTDQRAVQRIQSVKGSQDVTNVSVNISNVSVVHASGMGRVNDSQITSAKRMIDQGSELVSIVNPIRETRERDNQNDESTTQFKLRNMAHMAAEILSFQENISQEASSSQASLDMVSQPRLQQIDPEEGDNRSSQAKAILMPPSPQVAVRGSLHVDLISEMANQEVLRESSESSSSAFYTDLGVQTPSSQQEHYGRGRGGEIHEEALKLLAPEDTMASAQCLEEPSTQFVREFVKTARHEVLDSEIQKETNSDKLVYEGEKDKRKSSGQYGSADSQLSDRDSRQSSGGSGVKGPSDEMWDVADPSIQEPTKIKAPEDRIATKNTIVRKTGKSLWSIIADIVQLRWGSHAETPKSVRRSGGKSSSNDSVSSETWFSGHDTEEIGDKNVEREKRRMPKEASFSPHAQLMQTSTQGQGEVSDKIGSKNVISQPEGDMSSPSLILKSETTSKGIFSPSEEESLIWGKDGKNSQFSPPSMDVGEASSVPLSSSGMSTLIVEESHGRDRTDVSVSGSMKLMEQPVTIKSTEVSGPHGKDGALKQRKLQRNKQVVRDRFDEWEEAYIRETEQRKIDEMFMREALLEAKKAADTWEVPVGAVLVQHGKIIARGYNLVEELRDSTAHAEMICIREASNHLRTWRLAETTLYVTLEPCPMCAGAILQARIDTLVWGAPNKLLGADGSWIRLFPSGGEGNGSELTDKPAPPIHPFHPKMTIRRRILASDCADAMQQFFQLRRRQMVKNEDLPPKPALPIASHQSKFFHKMHDIFHAFLCL